MLSWNSKGLDILFFLTYSFQTVEKGKILFTKSDINWPQNWLQITKVYYNA